MFTQSLILERIRTDHAPLCLLANLFLVGTPLGDPVGNEGASRSGMNLPPSWIVHPMWCNCGGDPALRNFSHLIELVGSFRA